MSQNDSKFQSKGKKFGGGGKGRGKPGGGGFGKKFEGDKRGGFGGGGKRFGGKGEGAGDRPFKKPYRDRDSGQSSRGFDKGGDRPFKKPYRDRDSGGEGRSFDRKPRFDRSEGGDRPYKKPFRDRDSGGEGRSFDRKPRFDKGEGGDRPYKKPFRDRDSGGEGRSFDRKPRFDKGEGGDRPYKKPFRDRDGGGEGRSFDRKPRFDKGEGGDRPFKKPFRDRDSGGEGRSFDKGEGRDRKPRFGNRDDRPVKKHFRPRDEESSFGGRAGRQSFGAKKGRGSFDRRPTRSRDFQLDDDIEMELSAPASPETVQKLKSDRPGYGSPSSAFLYGVHAVSAALGNPKRLHQRLLVTSKGFEAVREAYEAAQAEGLTLPQPTYVEGIDIERLLPRDAVHQGLLLDSQPLEDVYLQDILIAAPDDAKILVLDQVTDPHNVGAILRSASAFGAVAVVVQKLHAPDVTGTLAKSASGAVEHVPIVREVNLTRALEQLKEAGYFCIGLAEEGKSTLSELHSKGKVALVMGAEGDGLRRLVAETCDTLAKLPTGGPVSSLNVSNAAAVALYELIRAA